MHEVFKREEVCIEDLLHADGLTMMEEKLRSELLKLMEEHDASFVVPGQWIKDYVREGLEEVIMADAKPVYEFLYGYIRWDELIEQSMKDNWFCEELSDGSEWWFND